MAELAHMTTVGQTDEKLTGRTLFGHPIGLANLFGVELWERFSFNGMLTILGYYLYYSVTEGGLELPKATGTGIVGAESADNSMYAVLSGMAAALRPTHSESVVSDHQPAARYRAASAPVTATPSTPITRSYESRTMA